MNFENLKLTLTKPLRKRYRKEICVGQIIHKRHLCFVCPTIFFFILIKNASTTMVTNYMINYIFIYCGFFFFNVFTIYITYSKLTCINQLVLIIVILVFCWLILFVVLENHLQTIRFNVFSFIFHISDIWRLQILQTCRRFFSHQVSMCQFCIFDSYCHTVSCYLFF